ncbi:hypothetical protein HZA96_01370 [Candidatus Woesearchaeota archaeon]|nr:hypothetical protein [Candidatus Woesearchaeota archaeon]
MQQSISIEDINAVLYHSNHLSLTKVYLSILTQRNLLEKQEFACDWDFEKSGVSLPNEVDIDQNIRYGLPVASFRRDGIGFYISYNAKRSSFIVNGQVIIIGERKTYGRFIQTISEVSNIAGVELNLKYIISR